MDPIGSSVFHTQEDSNEKLYQPLFTMILSMGSMACWFCILYINMVFFTELEFKDPVRWKEGREWTHLKGSRAENFFFFF